MANMRLSEETRMTLWPLLITVLLLATTGYAIRKLQEAACYRQWQDHDIPVQWGLLQGCRIDPQANGGWIPAESYRPLTP